MLLKYVCSIIPTVWQDRQLIQCICTEDPTGLWAHAELVSKLHIYKETVLSVHAIIIASI